MVMSGAMCGAADIVYIQDVYFRHPQPMLTIIEAAHDRIVAVVKIFPELKSSVPAGIQVVFGCRLAQLTAGAIGNEQPAHFRTQDKFKFWIDLGVLEQGVAKYVFRLAQAVHRRSIKVAKSEADAVRYGSLTIQQRYCGIHSAQRRRSQPQYGRLQIGLRDTASFSGQHITRT